MLKLLGLQQSLHVETSEDTLLPIEQINKLYFEDYWGENCHHWFVERKQLEEAKHFVNLGVLPIFNYHGLHPLHVLCMCHGDFEYAQWLISLNGAKNPISFSMPDCLGRTPLHFAANKGHLELIKYFITPATLNIRDHQDRTPLMACCMGTVGKDNPEQREATLLYLKEQGADFNAQDQFGHTALYYARHFFPYLLECFDSNEVMHMALDDMKDYFGCNEATRIFLSKKFETVIDSPQKFIIQDDLKFDAIHMFCHLGVETLANKAMLFKLVEIKFLDANNPSLKEILPLHIAASAAKYDFFKFLLDRTPFVNSTDKNERTFAMAACMPSRLNPENVEARVKIILALERRNADFTCFDRFNKTALDYAQLYFGKKLAGEVRRITHNQKDEKIQYIKNHPLPKHFFPGQFKLMHRNKKGATFDALLSQKIEQKLILS